MDAPAHDPEEEARLLAAARAGEERAFTALVRRHQHDVFRLALRMLGDRTEAEDVAQDVFVSVFLHVERFEERARLSTWLYRVTINHCHNRLRYLRRRASGRHRSLDAGSAERSLATEHAEEAPLGRPPPRPDRVAETRDRLRTLQRALQDLSEAQRTLVVLRDMEQLSYEEITAITDLPLGTVKSRLHRARLALAEALRRRGVEGA